MITNLQLIEKLENLSNTTSSSEEFTSLIQLLKFRLQTKSIELEVLTENITEGFAHCKIILDSNGVPVDYKFLSTNKAFTEQTGLKAKDVVGKTILEIYPNVEKHWIQKYGEVALTQKPDSFINFNHNADNCLITSAYSNTPGEFIMLVKGFSETHEFKLAKQEIKNSPIISTDILANMSEGFAHCEIICDENKKPIDYRVLGVNKAYEKQTGIKGKDIIGKTVLEFYPTIEKSWIEIYGNVALNNQSHSFTNFNHNTGKYYETNAFSLQQGQFALIFRDITTQETKRVELENTYKKAEENERLKSAFLANMSHEIRTPINAILGCSDLLENDSLKNEDRKKCLIHIKSSGNRLLNLISDIVDLSKIDAQQQKLSYKTHNLNQLIDRLREQFVMTSAKPEISFTAEKGLLDNKSNIKTDNDKLLQILSNLLENAFKFTATGKIEFGYEVKKDFLQFHVKDSGIGIKKKDQSQIFKRFSQVIDSKTKINSGSGLGISIVKGLVELFGGEIWVKSEVGKGSEFYFKIPYLPDNKEGKTDFSNLTILVAEDEDLNFYLLNMWMRDFCTIVHAMDGLSAVELFKKNPNIDLVLMDIRMPFMNGIEATKKIREFNIHVPIIAHTAYAMNDESKLMLDAGCTDILIKPVKKESFLKILEKYKNV